MKLSDDLAAVVGMEEASRAQCVKHLWAYIKDNNLQVSFHEIFTTFQVKLTNFLYVTGSREQTILHPRQKDGQTLWYRQVEGILHVQVLGRTPLPH